MSEKQSESPNDLQGEKKPGRRINWFLILLILLVGVLWGMVMALSIIFRLTFMLVWGLFYGGFPQRRSLVSNTLHHISLNYS